MRIIRFTIPVLASTLLAFLPGCENSEKSPGGVRVPAPATVLHQALRNRPKVASIYATGLMKIVDKPADFGLTVNAELLCGEPEKLRINATKVGSPAFDLGVNGKRILFYVPRKRTLYKGAAKDLDKIPGSFRTRELIRELLDPESHLGKRKWAYAKGSSAAAPQVVLLEKHAKGNPWWRVTLRLRRKQPIVIRTAEKLNGKDEVIFKKTYDRYHPVSKVHVPKGAKPQTMTLPHWTEISWPKRQSSIRLIYDEIQINYIAPANHYIPEIPEGVHIKPIQEAMVENDKSKPAKPEPKIKPPAKKSAKPKPVTTKPASKKSTPKKSTRKPAKKSPQNPVQESVAPAKDTP